MDLSQNEHWIKNYLPDLPNHKIADIQNDSQFKMDVISRLAQALGADFHQYIETPNDYSAKNNNKWQFFPNGLDKAILFLPDYIYDSLGEKQKEIFVVFLTSESNMSQNRFNFER